MNAMESNLIPSKTPIEKAGFLPIYVYSVVSLKLTYLCSIAVGVLAIPLARESALANLESWINKEDFHERC